MKPFWSAFAVAAVIAAVALPLLRRRAYKRGYFERREQTTRSRRERRTTIAGPVLVLATMAGALLSLEHNTSENAIYLGGALLLLPAFRSERGKAPNLVVFASRLLAALSVSVVGVRAEATGVPTTDVIITTIIVLATMGAFASLDHTDGTGPAIGAAAAGAVAAIALLGGQDDIVAAAAALVGGCLGILLHSLPPADVTLGRTGGPFIGMAIAVIGIEMHVPQDPDRALIAPALVIALPVIGAALSAIAAQRHRGERRVSLDGRLTARGLSPLAVVGLLGGAEVVLGALAYALANHQLSWRVAAAAGLVVLVVVFALALTAKPYAAPATGFDKRLVVVAVLAVIAVVGIGGYAAHQLLNARSHLEAGRDAAEQGLDAARAGDVDSARSRFATATTEFGAAKAELDSPMVSLGRVVPVLSQNIVAVRTVTAVGLDLSGTGVRVATRAGSDDIRITDGRFPIEQARSIGTDLTAALATLDQAAAELNHLDPEYLSTAVSDAVAALDQKIAGAREKVATVAQATAVLPAMFGGDGPRHYFLAILTPSELRGSGGIIGSFGQLDVTDGKITLVRLGNNGELNAATDPVRQRAALPAIYFDSFGGFLPDRFWQNLTAPADFAVSAQAIEAAYPLTAGGAPVDGVIGIDPIGLTALLRITGPVSVPSWPDPIGADNAEQVLLLDQYVRLAGDERDHFLNTVAQAVFDKLTAGQLAKPTALIDALAAPTAAGHVQLHSTHPDEQALFDTLGFSHPLPPLGGDSFELVTQNGSGSKIDYFLHRAIDYRATFDTESGTTTAAATITLTNSAPAKGLPNYVIGGPPGPVVPGDNRIYVTWYAPFELDGATIDGQPADFSSTLESDRHAYTFLTTIPPGATITIGLALHGTVSGGTTYLLDVGQQPVINLDHVHLEVTTTQGKQVSVMEPSPASMWDSDLTEPLRLVLRAPD